MKQLLLVLAIALFTSCSKSDSTACYEFRIRTEISVTPSQPNYPIRKDDYYDVCDLTDEEAKVKAQSWNSTTTTTTGSTKKTTKVFFVTMTKK